MAIRWNALATGLMLASGLALAAGDASTAKTPRERSVQQILEKWAPHVQEAYNVSPAAWAKGMASTFAAADLAALEQAALSTDFYEMSERLMGTAPTPLALNQALAAGGSTQALGDPDTDLVYVAVTPCRIIDTRVGGGAIPANTTRIYDVTAASDYLAQGGSATDCGIGGAGNFAAAVINFTVVSPSVAGFITAFPFQGTRPLAATLNYGAGEVRGNLAVVKLDQGASSAELSVYSFGQTHLVADVVGYFTNPAATDLNCVGTPVSSFLLPAGSSNFYNNPGCPIGYTATTPYCYTATAGVYSQGSGFLGNSPDTLTYCAWQNTTAVSQSAFGGNMCCRVPGR